MKRKFIQVTSVHLYISTICITYLHYSLHLSHIYTNITLQCSVLVSVPTHTFPCSVGQCTKVHSTRLEKWPRYVVKFSEELPSYTRLESCRGSCWSYLYNSVGVKATKVHLEVFRLDTRLTCASIGIQWLLNSKC